MLRFEYPPFDNYRSPLTPHLSGVYFPSFNASIPPINTDQSSDSEHSSFDDFSPSSFNDDNNNIIMKEENTNDFNENNDNKNVIIQDSSLLSDIVVDNPPSTADFYSNTPLFTPKTVTALPNDFIAPPTTNTLPPNASTNPLSEFVIADEAETENTSMVISDLPLLPPLVASLPTPLPAEETDDEAPRKKPKTSNSAPKKTTANRRGRKPAAAVTLPAPAVVPIIPTLPTTIADKRKTSTGSDDDNDYSDSTPSSADHYRTKHSISETRRRTRLRNQFKYLAEASASTKTDRYSVLCAAIVKIEAAKRRIAELETALSSSAAPMGITHSPSVSPTHSSMCCAESTEYGVCSQFSGVATALLTGDGVGTFLSANHRWLALMGVNSLSELQSLAPSFLKAVNVSNAEISNARSTLSAVSAHKHGSMTLPLDSNTILAFKNHSDSSIEPALLYANIRYFPTKSSRPALFTLSSYEHGAVDNRNPCVLATAVPCEPLPEGVTISSYNDRLAHRGRKGGHSDTTNTAPIKKEGKKRSYNQCVSSSASLATDGGEGEEDSGRGLTAFVSVRNPLNIDNDF